MGKKPWILLGLIGAFMLLGGMEPSAWSAPGKDVEFTSRAELEEVSINDQGKKEVKRVKAEKVLPGQVVVFTNSFVNNGKAPAADIVITNPIPGNMEFVVGSAFGDEVGITYSADGGEVFGLPNELTVTGPEGRQRPASPADFTHIRWTRQRPVPPKGEGQVGFKAILK